jgi:hypothetical protein
MNNKIFSVIFCVALMIGCSKENPVSQQSTQNAQQSDLKKAGGTQISGVGFIATDVECDVPGEGATYAVKMTGDLKGCLFIFIDSYKCRGNGFYFEKGREHFVGTYKGQPGSFWTTYNFEAKFEGCAENGSYLGAEIFGLCQHPIVEGSGDGVFKGATGRFHMIDLVEAGRYPYRGQFQLQH